VTIRLPAVDFLWVVHCDHASLALLQRYGCLKFFQEGSSKNRGRSLVVDWSSISHWSHILLFTTLGK